MIDKSDRDDMQPSIDESPVRCVTRRDFLKLAGIAGAAVGIGGGLSGLLASCGGGATTTTTAASTTTSAAVTTTAATTAATGGATVVTTAAAWTADTIEAKYGSYKMIHISHSIQQMISANWHEGHKQAAAAFGKDNAIPFEQSDFDANKLATLVETACTDGTQALSFAPVTGAQVKSCAAELQAAKVYFAPTWQVTDWNPPSDTGDYFVAFMSSMDFQIGYDMTKILCDHLGGKGNVVYVTGVQGSTADIQRSGGAAKALKEYPDIKLLASKDANYDLTQAVTVMEAFLAAYAQIDGVIAQMDDMGVGAWQAIKAAGKEIPIVSTDGSAEATLAIRDSFYLASLTTNPFWMGGYTYAMLWDALNGWKPSIEERMMFFKYDTVTKDNADKYYNTYWGALKEGKPLPYDWTKMSKVLYPDDWDPQGGLVPMDPNVLWQFAQKPARYELPAAYATADYAGVAKKYDGQWKTRLF